MLEVQIQTKDECHRTRIHVAVEAIGHLRIETIILGDGEYVGGCQVNTTIEIVIKRIE
jgi:hypothetical protein